MRVSFIILYLFYGITVARATTVNFDSTQACLEQSSHQVTKPLFINQSVYIEKGDYSDVDLYDFRHVDWNKFDFLEFEIVLPVGNKSELQGAIEDTLSTNYWSKLNFSQKLFPGVNHIKIALHELVGERGSHRYKRQIDFTKLKKIWFTLDVDNHFSFNKVVRLRHLRLTRKQQLPVFAGLQLFSFGRSTKDAFPCFNTITPSTTIKTGRWGFSTKANSAFDDKMADSLNRYSIDLGQAHFLVKVPNGKYRLALNIERLGYWEPPFWRKRILQVNGKTIKAELRFSPSDFEKYFLQFENIEPSPQDNPWDLYLSSLFKPVITTVIVKDGVIDISFDATEKGGILNWLAIWPSKQEQKAQKWLLSLNQQLRKDYQQIAHNVTPTHSNISKSEVVLMPKIKPISPWMIEPGKKKGTSLNFVHGYSKLLSFAIRSAKEQTFKITYTPNRCFDIVKYQGRYQFHSHDLNHQTYSLQSKLLIPLESQKLLIPANFQRQLFIRISENKQCHKFKGTWRVTFRYGKKQQVFTFKLLLRNRQLPSAPLSVGFLGLNAMRYDYFDHGEEQFRKARLEWSKKYIKEIAWRGFNTFSGLPSFEQHEAQDLLQWVKQFYPQFKKVFSYGGKFLEDGVTPKDYKNYLWIKQQGVKLIYTFSDEASGYSDRLQADIKQAQILQKKYPGLLLGGFSQMKREVSSLNKLFNEGSYLNYAKRYSKRLKAWGLYNLASAPDEDSSIAFGKKLRQFSRLGMQHLLGWHMSAVQNYPYFDLDGREADAMMLYPSSAGELYSTIKFEQATAGLMQYRLSLLKK